MTKDQVSIISEAIDQQENLNEFEADLVMTLADVEIDTRLSRKQDEALRRISIKLV